MDPQVRQLKLEHLKRRGAEALQSGNFRDAADCYSQALALAPASDRAQRRALLSNRSRAHLAAGRARDALADAHAAAKAAPGWAKAHWRAGRALGALDRWPEALDAYARAHELSGGDAECAGALRSASARLTLQQAADCLLELLLSAGGSPGGSSGSPRTQSSPDGTGRSPDALWGDDPFGGGWWDRERDAAAAPAVLIAAAARSFSNNGRAITNGGRDATPPAAAASEAGSHGVLAVVAAAADAGAPCQSGGAVAREGAGALCRAGAVVSTGGAGGGGELCAVDAEGRLVRGGAARLRREALREAMFLEVKASDPEWRDALCRWLAQPSRRPPPHEAALARAALAARLGLWRAARREARAAALLLAGRVEADEMLLTRQLVAAHALLGDVCMRWGARPPPADADDDDEADSTCSDDNRDDDISGGAPAFGGGAEAARGAQQVDPQDAAEAVRAYCTALDLLPPPRPAKTFALATSAAGGSERGPGGAGSRRSGGAAAAEAASARFAAWCCAQRRRLRARLTEARVLVSEAEIAADAPRARAAGGGGGGGGTGLDLGAGGPRAGAREGGGGPAVSLAFSWPPAPPPPLEPQGQRLTEGGGGAPPPAPAQHHPLAGGARAALLAGAAAAAGVPRGRVEMARAGAGGGGGGARVELQVRFEGERAGRLAAAFASGAGASLGVLAAACQGAGADEAAQLLRRWQEQGCGLEASMPPPAEPAPSRAGVPGGDERTSRGAGAEAGAGGECGDLAGAAGADSDSSGAGVSGAPAAADQQLAVAARAPDAGAAVPAPPAARRPARLQLAVALPYSSYRLVTSCGAPAERPDKHPFCMARVHYAGGVAGGGGGGVWFEKSDGSCRWRQTASEVEIICACVPPGLPASRLRVQIEPYYLKVHDAISDYIYLEGDLERGVVPADCVWTHGGGEGEDGCVVTLTKMNLEVFERPWQHSESWWQRLFEGDEVVAWDDADKDYSDLPPEIEALRLREEAREEAHRRAAALDRSARKRLQDLEDSRKRRRQQRLQEMKRACWAAAAAAAGEGEQEEEGGAAAGAGREAGASAAAAVVA